MANEQLILSLNCGSSSLKFGVYRATAKDPDLVCQGEAEEIGRPNGSFWFKHGEVKDQQQKPCADHGAALTHALELLAQQGIQQFWKAGHRVVHGGPKVREHQALTPAVLARLTSGCAHSRHCTCRLRSE